MTWRLALNHPMALVRLWRATSGESAWGKLQSLSWSLGLGQSDGSPRVIGGVALGFELGALTTSWLGTIERAAREYMPDAQVRSVDVGGRSELRIFTPGTTFRRAEDADRASGPLAIEASFSSESARALLRSSGFPAPRWLLDALESAGAIDASVRVSRGLLHASAVAREASELSELAISPAGPPVAQPAGQPACVVRARLASARAVGALGDHAQEKGELSKALTEVLELVRSERGACPEDIDLLRLQLAWAHWLGALGEATFDDALVAKARAEACDAGAVAECLAERQAPGPPEVKAWLGPKNESLPAFRLDAEGLQLTKRLSPHTFWFPEPAPIPTRSSARAEPDASPLMRWVLDDPVGLVVTRDASAVGLAALVSNDPALERFHVPLAVGDEIRILPIDQSSDPVAVMTLRVGQGGVRGSLRGEELSALELSPGQLAQRLDASEAKAGERALLDIIVGPGVTFGHIVRVAEAVQIALPNTQWTLRLGAEPLPPTPGR